MLAVSSKLMTTELLLFPTTKHARSLHGSPASTDTGLIRVKKDPDELGPKDEGPASDWLDADG